MSQNDELNGILWESEPGMLNIDYKCLTEVAKEPLDILNKHRNEICGYAANLQATTHDLLQTLDSLCP